MTTPRLADRFTDLWCYAEMRRNDAVLPPLPGDPVSTQQIISATVSRGRRSVVEHPGPATTTVTAIAQDGVVPQPGDRLDVFVNRFTMDAVDLAGERRFTGEVHTSSLDVDRGQLLDDGGRPAFTAQAIDPVARLSRRIIKNQAPWPQEDASVRFLRIRAAAQMQGFVAPTTGLQVIARDIDRQPAWTLMTELAEHTGAIVRVGRDTNASFIPANTRGSASPVVTIDARRASAELTWSASDTDKVTRATVTYGTNEPQAELEVINDAAEVFGSTGGTTDRREVRIISQLATATDARTVADDLVGRRSVPLWEPSSIRIPVGLLLTRYPPGSPEAADVDDFVRALLTLECEQLVQLSGFPSVVGPPSGEPRPTANGPFWVIGMSETITPHRYDIELFLAPYAVYADVLTWDQVPDSITWDDVPSWVTWQTVPAWQPQQDTVATWTSVPANIRWDDVPDSVTWDTADTLIEE